jgi:hypothetical protein
LNKVTKEDLLVSLEDVALSSNRDGSEHVVTSGHDGSDVSLVQGGDDISSDSL